MTTPRGEFYYFKYPAIEDIMETEVSSIVKYLPKTPLKTNFTLRLLKLLIWLGAKEE